MRTPKAICLEREHFGYPLRDARLKAGRSLDDISRRTKIPTATLERLEEGDRAALPADVFVVGFLRAYAREVGLDGDTAVSGYKKLPILVEERQVVDPEAEIVRHAIPVEARETQPTPPDLGLVARLSAKLQVLLDGNTPGVAGRGPSFALVVLLVVLVATITLSLLLGGDPRPGRGLS
jgi:cytoskeleton protein RodZ